MGLIKLTPGIIIKDETPPDLILPFRINKYKGILIGQITSWGLYFIAIPK